MGVRDIVKIQRPLSTNAPQPMALVYNRDRSTEFQTPWTRELARDVFGVEKNRITLSTPAKIYAEVEMFGAEMRFIRLVEDQDW